MKEIPKVSIIIPLYIASPRFFRDLKKFDHLDYPDFEILVVSDKKVKLPAFKKAKARLILTGQARTGPAEKRDIALKKAYGSICAFIDDDAYPDSNWLKAAIPHFDNPKIAAVGGPGLTPKEDSFWEQITGLVYESIFGSGAAQNRFVKGKSGYVDDYPAYNLLIRTIILKEVGGYGSYFYGGEDTFLCIKIIKRGYKIKYEPEVAVYHHRRALFLPYLKQISNIGVHRGYFAKKYPETSRRIGYIFPTILALGFFVGVTGSFFNDRIKTLFLITFFILFSLAFTSVVFKSNFLRAFFASLGVILTHLVYGMSFIKGLLTKKLIR